MELKTLTQASDGILKWQQDINWQTQIQEIVSDSRQVKPGSLFVAIRGEQADGHLYIEQALKAGAAIVILEDAAFCNPAIPWLLASNSRKVLGQLLQFYVGQPSLAMSVIGVTGTNGKTTVTNMIAAIMEENQKRIGLLGTISNRIGDQVKKSSLTTPDCAELAACFSQMAEAKTDYAIMEVSSHALAQNRVAGIEFDLAVFTNLTQDHLDFHGTMEEYLAQKSRLFSGLEPQGRKKRKKMAILNKDDSTCDYLEDHCRVPVITYGLQEKSLVRAAHVKLSDGGLGYDVIYANQTFPVTMQLHGQFNVYNSLAAIGVALVEGVPIQVIQQALSKMKAIPGRFQKVLAAAPFSVFIDYSHTPDSLKNCIATAREFCKGRIITVFGAGGHRDRGKRPIMGEIAGRLSDVCFVTSDNPREESPEGIIQDILAGMKGPYTKAKIVQMPDRRQAIGEAIGLGMAGDVILICGKGHENYQIIGEETLHFDDYEEALSQLQKRQ